MKKAKIAYKSLEYCTPEEVQKGKVDDMYGYQDITCNVIFDLKMNITLNYRFVDNGNKNEAPVALTNSSVISRDSIRLEFLIAALNDLYVMACDIRNVYLNAPCKENIWFKVGAECGEHQGKVMILVRALYGLKTSGLPWRSMFKAFIENNLNFK